MTPEEIGDEILNELTAREEDTLSGAFYENPLDFKLTIARILAAKLQFALTTRTEQCAKMIEAFGSSDKWVIWNNPQCGLDLHEQRSMDLLASEIRALNQPPPTEEKKS